MDLRSGHYFDRGLEEVESSANRPTVDQSTPWQDGQAPASYDGADPYDNVFDFFADYDDTVALEEPPPAESAVLHDSPLPPSSEILLPLGAAPRRGLGTAEVAVERGPDRAVGK